MALPVIARLAASQLAKRGAKRGEKFMGMVEEVGPKRLADETMRAGARGVGPQAGKGMAGKAALGIGAAGAAGLATMDREEAAPKRVSAAPREEAPMEREEAATAPSKAAAGAMPAKKTRSGELSPFGKEFKAARAAGKSVFDFNGKKYNTMLAGESKEDHKEALARIKAKNEAAYEKKIEELAMRKGGMAKKPAAKKPVMKKPMMKKGKR